MIGVHITVVNGQKLGFTYTVNNGVVWLTSLLGGNIYAIPPDIRESIRQEIVNKYKKNEKN